MSRTKEKTVCRAALVDLLPGSAQIFKSAFASFRITTVEDDALDFTKQKYDAAVVSLNPGNEKYLEAIRTSKLNRHMIIYGVATPATEFKAFSRFGMNAYFPHPLERQAVVKAIRSTHLLVLHEYRRYARIPVMVEVIVNRNGTRFQGTTVEVSGGGMSFSGNMKVKEGERVEVGFTLPDAAPIRVWTTVSWVDGPDSSTGVRFELEDERRRAVRAWVDNYLEIR